MPYICGLIAIVEFDSVYLELGVEARIEVIRESSGVDVWLREGWE
jgi:hypothetical protein